MPLLTFYVEIIFERIIVSLLPKKRAAIILTRKFEIGENVVMKQRSCRTVSQKKSGLSLVA